jgi:NADH-quinone oxidoreductase subunit M
MPGSSNFVGELLILFGTFQQKLAYGIVASVGVVLAAVYMIRLYQRSMHNRAGPAVEPRDLALPELATIVPLVGVILALSIYPQIVLQRSEPTSNGIVTSATGAHRGASGVLARSQGP